jgi:hypothetical protein
VVLARPGGFTARILTVWRNMSRRRALVGASVSLLVTLDIVLWLHLFDSGGGGTDVASPEPTPASDMQSPSTSDPDATVTGSPGPIEPSASEPSATATFREHAFTCRLGALTAHQLETVKVFGRYADEAPGSELRVQMQRGAKWVDFPLPTVVQPSGRYKTYVEVGHLGRNKLRVVDPASGAVSNIVTLVVR